MCSMLYFRHDVGASRDSAVMALRITCGSAAVDAYWAIVEEMYSTGCPVDLHSVAGIAIAHTCCMQLGELVDHAAGMVEVGLLVEVDGGLWSKRVESSLIDYNKDQAVRSKGGRASAAKRASKKTFSDNNDVSSSEYASPVEQEREDQLNRDCNSSSTDVATPVEQNGEDQLNREDDATCANKNKIRIKEEENNKDLKNTRAVFRPPSAQEVEEYARSNGLAMDAHAFVDYYAAQGWKLSNGQKMKDWHAAANNWARRERERFGGSPARSVSSGMSALAASYGDEWR